MINCTIKSGIFAILFIVCITSLTHAFTITPYVGGYRFEGNSNVGDTLMMGLGVDYQLTDKFASELIYLRGKTDLNYLDINTHQCVTQESIDTSVFHFSGRYHLLQSTHFVPYITAGLGILSMDTDYAEMFKDDPDQHYLFQFHYGGGLIYRLTDTLCLRGDLRHMISFDNMDNDLSAIVGISYTFGLPAKKKRNDQKPRTKQEDTSKSETKDHTDTHPKPDKKRQETPKKSTQIPSTHKEIEKNVQPLPQAMETKTSTDPMSSHQAHSNVSANAHEESQTQQELKMAYLDTDADGILDHTDKCPNTPKNVKVNMFGCAPDNDRDGVIDVEDQCPGTPVKTKVDQYGCPIKTIVLPAKQAKRLPKKTLQYQVTIEFDYKSSQVKDIYDKQLAKIVLWLKKLEDPIIVIKSHTDNIGSQIYNINLSDKRADSVKKYLYRHFHIPEHQVKSYSYGETQPITDNSTEEGRQKNRRAEIIVTEKKQ